MLILSTQQYKNTKKKKKKLFSQERHYFHPTDFRVEAVVSPCDPEEAASSASAIPTWFTRDFPTGDVWVGVNFTATREFLAKFPYSL